MSGHDWSPETRAEFALLAPCGYRDGCTCAVCLRSVPLTKEEAAPAFHRASDVKVCGLLRISLSGQVLHTLAKKWASTSCSLDKTTWAQRMSAGTVKDRDMLRGPHIQSKSATRVQDLRMALARELDVAPHALQLHWAEAKNLLQALLNQARHVTSGN